MRTMVFASRNRKEILRDPLNLAFGIGFPVVLLVLLSAIQANVPVDLFEIRMLAPGVAVFGLSFVSLFSGTLIAKDRGSAYLTRLFTSPLSAADFIVGYTLPLLPMAIVQIVVCFLVSTFLGLSLDFDVFLSFLVLLPTTIFFIAIGLLAGSIFNDKQVGAICGALLTNLSAWLSGTWFDLNLVGGTFKTVAYLLPFVHAVDASKVAMAGDYSEIIPHLLWVTGYAVITMLFAIRAFQKNMNGES